MLGKLCHISETSVNKGCLGVIKEFYQFILVLKQSKSFSNCLFCSNSECENSERNENTFFWNFET